MRRKAAQFAAWAIVVIGIVHIAATPIFYDSYGEPALWFISGGLAFVALGLLNLVYIWWNAGERRFQWILGIANLVTLAFLVALAIELPGDIPPRVAIPAVLIAATTVPFVKPR